MNQRTFASQVEFEKYGRKSRRELFLDDMERIIPWSALLALVRPHYVKAGNGRRPVGDRLRRDAEAGRGQLQRHTLLHYFPGQQLSTPSRQSGILMTVHSVCS